jgi:hypothetical protein
VRIANYVKTAFLNQWNLLAVAAGAVFGIISGAPDIVLPLVSAGELAYLGLLSTHPKFQKYVDAQAAKASRTTESAATQRTLERITQSLPRSSLERFESLRSRCLELQQIATALKHPGKQPTELLFEDFQNEGLDRLLWIHLRLLYTEYALERFLRKTSEKEILEEIAGVEERLGRVSTDAATPQQTRIRKALEDNLQTLRDRLANLQKARDNCELVQLELERLENKIRSLSELAVNRQEPDYISGQVDQVASSMLDTEKTMNELQFATGLEAAEDPPDLLRERKVQLH